MSDAESQKRRHLSADQKVAIVKRYLVEKTPISDLCDQYGIQPSQVYQWQKVLFENGVAAFERANRRAEDAKDRQVAALQAKVQQKNEVIAELMQEHVQLKKATTRFRARMSRHSVLRVQQAGWGVSFGNEPVARSCDVRWPGVANRAVWHGDRAATRSPSADQDDADARLRRGPRSGLLAQSARRHVCVHECDVRVPSAGETSVPGQGYREAYRRHRRPRTTLPENSP
jgi:transposase